MFIMLNKLAASCLSICADSVIALWLVQYLTAVQ